MYGRGSGDFSTTSVTSGPAAAVATASTVGSAAILPVTGGNTILMILSITTMVVGALIAASFIVTRVASKLAK